MTTEPTSTTTPVSERPGVMACIRKRVDVYCNLLRRFQEDDDVELIHDLRVASRRLREGLRVLAATLNDDPCSRLISWLREARGVVGPLRDADVQQQLFEELLKRKARLAKRRACSAFAAKLTRHRRYLLIDARFQLTPAVAAKHHEEATRILDEAAGEAGSPQSLDAVLGEKLGKMVGRRRGTFRRAADKATASGKPEKLHAARIACKKLRYTLELAEDSGTLDAKREIKALRRIQDWLGHLNDLVRLREYVALFAVQARPGRRKDVEAIVSLIDRRRRRLTERFIDTWPKRRRRLKKAKAQPYPDGRHS